MSLDDPSFTQAFPENVRFGVNELIQGMTDHIDDRLGDRRVEVTFHLVEHVITKRLKPLSLTGFSFTDRHPGVSMDARKLNRSQTEIGGSCMFLFDLR